MKETGKNFSVQCDPEGKILEILYDEQGILAGDLIGKSIFTCVVPGDLDKILNFFMELKSKGSALGWEINLTTPSGAETFSFFGGQFGNRIGIAAATTKNGAQVLFAELTRINNEQANLIRSITKEMSKLQSQVQEEPGIAYYEELSRLNNELVNMQREMTKKNRELDELDRMKNQFLGLAAHDLRNPIGIVINYSEFLLDHAIPVTEKEQQELLARINRTGHFMLGLVNDLLDIANIESGKLELNRTRETLEEVILTNISMNELFARAKSMLIRFKSPGTPVIVDIDRPKIEQVLTNLISNAIKYSDPGTDITVGMTISGDFVTIRVCDQGQGIVPEEIPMLFQPFQKASSRSTGGEKSTGLGLSIVKKIVEAHGGITGVLSEYGKGSEFFFTLPVISDPITHP